MGARGSSEQPTSAVPPAVEVDGTKLVRATRHRTRYVKDPRTGQMRKEVESKEVLIRMLDHDRRGSTDSRRGSGASRLETPRSGRGCRIDSLGKWTRSMPGSPRSATAKSPSGSDSCSPRSATAKSPARSGLRVRLCTPAGSDVSKSTPTGSDFSGWGSFGPSSPGHSSNGKSIRSTNREPFLKDVPPCDMTGVEPQINEPYAEGRCGTVPQGENDQAMLVEWCNVQHDSDCRLRFTDVTANPEWEDYPWCPACGGYEIDFKPF